MIKKFENLKLIFSADNKLSSMRIFVFMIISIILFNWTYINIITQTIHPFDFGTVFALIGSLAVQVSQKIGAESKYGCEEKENEHIEKTNKESN